MELHELYSKLIAEGCNHFYIENIGGPISDGIDCLGEQNGKWEVYYKERGQKSPSDFSTSDKQEAIQYYYNHVKRIEHWHLVVFTRSAKIINDYRSKLEQLGIRVIQNDIPDYSKRGDRIFRLFVTNTDIFIANKELDGPVPYYDRDLG